eukprot:4678080-Pyramimonas_sp.AAC.1
MGGRASCMGGAQGVVAHLQLQGALRGQHAEALPEMSRAPAVQTSFLVRVALASWQPPCGERLGVAAEGAAGEVDPPIHRFAHAG